MAKKQSPEDFWHSILTGDNPALPLRQLRAVWALLPANPRCTFCNAPFSGPGAPLMRLLGRGRRRSRRTCAASVTTSRASRSAGPRWR